MRKRSEPKRIWSGPKNGREWQRNCEGYWLAGVAAERRPSYSVYWWNLDSSFSSYRHVGASWGPLAVILVVLSTCSGNQAIVRAFKDVREKSSKLKIVRVSLISTTVRFYFGGI